MTPNVAVDEPDSAARIRYAPDLVRALLGALGMAVVIGLGRIPCVSSLGRGIQPVPPVLLDVGLMVLPVAVVVVLAGLAVERVHLGDTGRVVEAVGVAVLAYGLSLAVNLGIAYHVDLYVACVCAYVTVAGFGNRAELKRFVWLFLFLDGLAVVLSATGSLSAVLLAFLLGRTVAFAWRYLRGVPDRRPRGARIAAQLADKNPVTCRRMPDAGETRRYEVTTANGAVLDVTVLDRARQAVGLPYRLYEWARFRPPAQRRDLLPLRQALEQEALMAYATRDAGVRTPRLVAMREVDSDTMLLAHARVTGRSVAGPSGDEGTDDAETDRLLAQIWAVLAHLQRHQLAHRRLTLDNLLLDGQGRLWLLDLRAGEVAAEQASLHIDTAELLVAVSLRWGAERAVRSAANALGGPAVVAAAPMLQPMVMSSATRSALRRQQGDVPQEIREAVRALRTEADVEPAPLERVPLRTLVSIVGGVLVAYLLASQLTHIHLPQLTAGSVWAWIAAGLGAGFMSYVSSAWAIRGFSAKVLTKAELLFSQYAATYIGLMAPGGTGVPAVDARVLQRSGVPMTAAIASVGAMQCVAFVENLLLLLFFSVISGKTATLRGDIPLPPSSTIITVVLAVVALAVVAWALPPVRRNITDRFRPALSGALTRLVEVLHSPARMAGVLIGTAGGNLSYVVGLWAAVNAYGGNVGIAPVAVVFLVSMTVGSAIPTPGGVGAFEAACSAGLIAAGMPTGTALSAVLLFRIVTYWLPILIGWRAFPWLRRRQVL